MDKLLLTPEEAAKAVAVGRSKLYELLRAGEIESVRIGTSRRIPRPALEEFVGRLREQERAVVAGDRERATVEWRLGFFDRS